MYQANVYKIFLASPSDVIEERDMARAAIAYWNKLHSEKEKIILRDIGWEKDAFASTSQDGNGQDKINEQLLKDADFLIGIFWAKIGTATEAFNSGTLEEIDKHIKAGKEAMLCFSNEALPQNHDKEQFEKLTGFKNECYKTGGLVQTYSKSDFHKIIYEALTRRVNKKEPFVGFSQQIEPEEQVIPVNSDKLEKLGDCEKESVNFPLLDLLLNKPKLENDITASLVDLLKSDRLNNADACFLDYLREKVQKMDFIIRCDLSDVKSQVFDINRKASRAGEVSKNNHNQILEKLEKYGFVEKLPEKDVLTYTIIEDRVTSCTYILQKKFKKSYWVA